MFRDVEGWGGRLAIVLPETAFHAPSTQYLRDFIEKRGAILAVIGLPHNSFRPHCNAKTCLLVVQKGSAAPEHVIMAAPHEMGQNHQGKPIYRPGTDEIWNDLPIVLDELDDPSNGDNEFVFTLARDKVKNHLIPHYYAYQNKPHRPPHGRKWVSLGQLVDEKIVRAWDGHGSPTSAEKGEGEIPYIRVSDIVNWELYRNPTSGVDEATYERFTRNAIPIEPEDIIFVRRGSYRIGTVAMASSRDAKVMLTRELLTLRVKRNDMGLTPYYLLALLSSSAVQDQIDSLVFVDTTLPTIGDRWRELRLPIHKNAQEITDLSNRVKSAVNMKWEAQRKIQSLRKDIGDLVT